MKVLRFSLLAVLLGLFFSCASRPVYIPEDLTPMELIQRAQEASDRNRFAVSLQYYDAVLDRFSHDIDSVIAAEYEIAFINYKQNRFETARVQFHSILERYDDIDGALLPPQFRVLSNRVLETMDEVDARRRPRSRL